MCAQGHLGELRAMYKEWPFFAATVDLIEMILAKTDARIAGLYEDVLVTEPEQQGLGGELRRRLTDTIKVGPRVCVSLCIRVCVVRPCQTSAL